MKTLAQKVLPKLQSHISRACLFAGFLLLSLNVFAQPTVATGKSYINVSRPNGGTFLPGDVIEVRATIAVTGGTSSSSTNRVNNVRYNDTINLTKFDYVIGSLQMLSNEGHLQNQFTDAASDDVANIDIASGKLRFNIGSFAGTADVNSQGTSTTNAGRLWGALLPTFYSSTCIRMYVYRLTIKNTASIVAIDSAIVLNAGNFRYQIGSGSDVTSNFSPYTIRIAPDYGLCSNSIGTNAIVGESGGTFGSGVAQNKAGGTTFVPAPYAFQNFSTGQPVDNNYGVANNTSADGSTNPNVSNPNSTSRVFSVWDIIGDHTGATDPYQGNLPTNTGYAVIINASYQTNRAFTQTISNLCEETYYEFSAWFRNICRKCGCDSSGKGATQSGYTPSPGNDSSGVRPNLSFQIDGEEYYTSGNIPYTGLWIKKGFVYKTRPGQTSMTVTIRNNAPGGGGNDWAIDDIGVSTCLPNMKYSPSITPNVCEGSYLTIYDTVRSYFNNYTNYKWQRSTDGGTNWSDVSSAATVTPTWNGTAWQFISSYTIPPAQTTPANSNDKYRLVVATSTTNLSDVNCRSTDPTTIVTVTVLTNCIPLDVKLNSFSGKATNNKATLKWTTTNEPEQVYFDIQKSYDGNSFTTIASINSNGSNSYTYNDPDDITRKIYYRLKIRSQDNKIYYSRILQLSDEAQKFSFVSVINPFNSSLFFDISSTANGVARAELVDPFGNPVKRKILDIREGVTQFTFENINALSAGMYVLKVEMNDAVIYRKVLKQNH